MYENKIFFKGKFDLKVFEIFLKMFWIFFLKYFGENRVF
jgi:hypothetical protein